MQAKYSLFIAIAITVISCAHESKSSAPKTESVSDMASAVPAAPPAPESGGHQKQKAGCGDLRRNLSAPNWWLGGAATAQATDRGAHLARHIGMVTRAAASLVCASSFCDQPKSLAPRRC